MSFGKILTFTIALTVLCVPALADDLVPPSWRGQQGTTFQMWEFSTPSNPAVPEVVDNINGTPMAVIFGEPPLTQWWAEDRGRLGVWEISEMIELQIPNFPEPNPYKEIWIQVTYDAGAASLPEFFVMPAYTTLELVQSIPLTDAYTHDTYRIVIEPNPVSESIYVMPRYCDIFIDEIVVDTICVPEPATLCLLGFGSIALLRRRRVMH